MPSSSRLFSGASFAQQWRGFLHSWFDAVCTNSWRSPLPTVALVPSRAHGYFLRGQLLKEGLSFAGIRFWTPADARAFLVAQFSIDKPAATRENLRLLLAAAAEMQVNTPAADAVALDPDSFLRVLHCMAAAGWRESDCALPALGEMIRQFNAFLAETGLSTLQQTDESLLASARENVPVIGSILVYGFNPVHWPLWTILRAIAHSAADRTICLDQLRPAFSETQAAWIGSWEEEFGVAEAVAAVDEADTFHDLAAAIEEGQRASHRDRVTFRVGANTREQAEIIVAQTLEWLDGAGAERIGLVFPAYGALSREVAALLEARRIPHNDAIGHLRPGVFEHDAWESWLALQERPRLGNLVRFARVCPPQVRNPLHADEIEDVLRRASEAILVNDLGVLAVYLEQTHNSEKRQTIGAFVRRIELLPENASFAQFNEVTARIFDHFGWISQQDEVARQSLQLQSFSAQISRRAYLRWLADVVDSFQRVRDEHGAHPYARVQLVSYDHAQAQSWSHLILTSLNEGMWPPRPVESGYLSESEIDTLNERILAHNKGITRVGRQGQGHITVAADRAFCLGPRQERSLVRAQFAALIETAALGLCATASLLNESDPARRLKPGDFFNRLYFADRGAPVSDREMDALHAPTRLAISRATSTETAEQSVAGPMLRAFKVRRDLAQPFGEFEFSLKTPPARQVTIACSEWDRIVDAPAAIWMKNFAGVEPPVYEERADLSVTTLGTWVHDWLARISPESRREGLTPFPAPEEFLAAVRKAANGTRAEIEALVASAGRALPSWWLSVWSQAAYVSGKLAGLIAAVPGWTAAASELRLKPPVDVALTSGTLRVSGRIDLLLADGQSASTMDLCGRKAWIIDYKTGGYSELSSKDLERGHGFQLALYALAVHRLGATAVDMTILKPDVAAVPQLTSEDLAGFERVWDELCRMQDSGIFGANGDMRGEFGRGAIYPLATLEIDPDVLANKWELTHRGFVLEEDDETT